MISFKTFSYYISLSLVLAVIAFFFLGSWLAIPVGLCIALLWVINSEVKKHRLTWSQMLLHALFLTIVVTLSIFMISDKWRAAIPFIVLGCAFVVIENKINQSVAKRFKIIVQITFNVLVAGGLLYWHFFKGLHIAWLVGFCVGAALQIIEMLKQRYVSNELEQDVAGTPDI